MYDALDGTPTKDPAPIRITRAKDAVRAFHAHMTNPGDRVGLASLNTLYTGQSRAVGERERIAGLLDGIRKPGPDEAYTELYGSLELAARELAGIRGRKAIVVLSDGENYPYTLISGREHPLFKRRTVAYTEPILASQEEAVTVYGITFGRGSAKDRNLRAIAAQTGGTVFDAQDRPRTSPEQSHRAASHSFRIGCPAALAAHGTEAGEKAEDGES